MFGLSTVELLALIGALYPIVLLAPESLFKFVKWLSVANFERFLTVSWVGNVFIGGVGGFTLFLFSINTGTTPNGALVSSDLLTYFSLIFGLYWFDLNITLTYGGLKTNRLDWVVNL